MTHLLTLIVVLPLVGFLLNGLLATRSARTARQALRHRRRLRAADRRRSLLTVACFLDLQAGGGAPLIETAYTWARDRRAHASRSRSTSTGSPR